MAAGFSTFVHGLCAKLQAFAAATATELPPDVDKELRRLVKALLAIQMPAVEAVEELPCKNKAIRAWLGDLKKAAFDADDLLDLLPLKATEGEAPTVDTKSTAQSRCLLFPCLGAAAAGSSSSSSSCPDRSPATRAIKAVRRRVEKLARKQLWYLYLHFRSPTRSRIESIGSALVEPRVLGRDGDVKQVIQLLTCKESAPEKLSAVAIVGRGGVGKTTLGRLVYEDRRVAEHFQVKRWVAASKLYGMDSLLRSIFESLAGYPPSMERSRDEVVEMIMENIAEKTFLLVLDGVRSETVGLEHLKAGLSGAKVLVLVTTRDEETGNAMQVPSSSHHLKGLSFEDCWLLFRTCACLDRAPAERMEALEAVGKKIVTKLEGLPLAARMVGSLLCSNFELEAWKVVLDSDAWNSNSDEHGLPAALWLSYQQLPPHVKQCFAYCSVIPKGHEFDKDRLIHMWMAQELIQPWDGVRIEELGSNYFDHLLHRAFFQCSQGSKYVMHDSIHDLAVSVTVGESLSFPLVGVEEPSKASEKVRHLTLLSDNFGSPRLLDSGMLERLRTLASYRAGISSFDYDALFVKLRCVRVMCLSDEGLEELPDSIGNLKQLRCLDLSDTSITMVPEAVCNLSNLQTLKLSEHSSSLQLFPQAISNLINLRHLKSNSYQISKISGLGKLTLLQELEEFEVSHEEGRRIQELERMAQLRGRLCISHLENVQTEEEAEEAKLNEKEHLRKLELQWSWDYSTGSQPREVDEPVLQGLRPHPNLKELCISYYMGASSPSWLRDGHVSGLETLELVHCTNWEPPCLLHSQSLRSLRILGMDKLRQVAAAEECRPFPCLSSMDLAFCAGTEEGLNPIPLSLETLKLHTLDLLALPELQQSETSSTSYSLLSSVEIVKCYRLTTLQVGLLQHQDQYRLRVLEKLNINGCRKLSCLPDQGFSGLVSLKSLHLEDCRKLKYLPENGRALPSSLVHLKIIECPALICDSFFVSLEGLHSLSSMLIKSSRRMAGKSKYPLLTSLPGEILQHLTALVELEIIDCSELVTLGFQVLGSLKHLRISGCPNLAASRSPVDKAPLLLEYLEVKESSLGMLSVELLHSLTFLQELQILGCDDDLVAFSDEVEEGLRCLSSLKRLHIHECRCLRSLPRELGSIRSLEELYIIECDAIESMPEKGVPASLLILVIKDCCRLKQRCKFKRQDWPKIAHVFYVSIDERQVRTDAVSESSSHDSSSKEEDF